MLSFTKEEKPVMKGGRSPAQAAGFLDAMCKGRQIKAPLREVGCLELNWIHLRVLVIESLETAILQFNNGVWSGKS